MNRIREQNIAFFTEPYEVRIFFVNPSTVSAHINYKHSKGSSYLDSNVQFLATSFYAFLNKDIDDLFYDFLRNNFSKFIICIQ